MGASLGNLSCETGATLSVEIKTNSSLTMCEPVFAEYKCAGKERRDLLNESSEATSEFKSCAIAASADAPAVVLKQCSPGDNPHISISHETTKLKDTNACSIEAYLNVSCTRGGTPVTKCKGSVSRTNCQGTEVLSVVCSGATSRFNHGYMGMEVVGSLIAWVGVGALPMILFAVGLASMV